MASCPHPASARELEFAARDYVTGDAFSVVKCRECGLVVTSPTPEASALARYYPSAYYGTPGARRFPSVVEALQRGLYRRRARAVEHVAGGVGRVLDIGCGRGFLLDAFRSRGWQVQGTELSDDGARYAREVMRVPVHAGDENTWPWGPGEFDAAVLWHVLEHSPDPGALLRCASRVLRPGGALLVSVPNFASPEARFTREGWFHLDVPRHLVHFTPASLGALLDEAGFEVARTSYFAPEFDAFSFVQSVLNRLHLPANLLYDLLRNRRARFQTKWSRGAVLGTLALSVPLSAFAPVATAALGVLRRGSTLVVHARKTR